MATAESLLLEHFSYAHHRSSRSQKFFKIAVLKIFAILAGKQLCWSLFLITLQALGGLGRIASPPSPLRTFLPYQFELPDQYSFQCFKFYRFTNTLAKFGCSSTTNLKLQTFCRFFRNFYFYDF